MLGEPPRSGAPLTDVGGEDDRIAEVVARSRVVVPAARDESQRRPARIPVDTRRREPGLQVLSHRRCLEYRRPAAAEPDIYPISRSKVAQVIENRRATPVASTWPRMTEAPGDPGAGPRSYQPVTNGVPSGGTLMLPSAASPSSMIRARTLMAGMSMLTGSASARAAARDPVAVLRGMRGVPGRPRRRDRRRRSVQRVVADEGDGDPGSTRTAASTFSHTIGPARRRPAGGARPGARAGACPASRHPRPPATRSSSFRGRRG